MWSISTLLWMIKASIVAVSSLDVEHEEEDGADSVKTEVRFLLCSQADLTLSWRSCSFPFFGWITSPVTSRESSACEHDRWLQLSSNRRKGSSRILAGFVVAVIFFFLVISCSWTLGRLYTWWEDCDTGLHDFNWNEFETLGKCIWLLANNQLA